MPAATRLSQLSRLSWVIVSIPFRSPVRRWPCHRPEHGRPRTPAREGRSEEHTSELQSLMRISYAVFCLNKKKDTHKQQTTAHRRSRQLTVPTHHDTKKTG